MSKLQELLKLFDDPQHARLLRLSFPHDNAPEARLLVNSLKASEYLSRDFKFTVELLSDDAGIEIEALMGKLLCVSQVRADGRLRHYTGHVSQFKLIKTDGGVAFYEALLVPWFEFMRLRQNNRLFHGQTLAQQVQSICEAYGALPAWEWRVTGEAPAFTMAVQYGETDHNYLSRRLEAAGLPYWYEHTDQGHRWVVHGDTYESEPVCELSADIRYHGEGGSEDEDAISQWSPVRRSVSAAVAASGFDFKKPLPMHASVPTLHSQGDVPGLEVHSYEGHYGFKRQAGAEELVRRRIEEIETRGMQYEARSNCARVQAGRWFRFADHFRHSGDDVQMLIVEAHHEATNNYLQDSAKPAEYKNTFICQSRKTPWRPGKGFNSVDTKILAPQTAIVVGPKGQGSLNVDEYGRVQLRFHWDRDETSSCWVRVATHWAGAENGLASHPRVGSEVVVQWLDGNPDHPLVTGAVHNHAYMPPWELPEQGALTGIRSRELTPDGGNAPGGRSNHLVLDDTPGKMQAQMKSDHLCSQVSTGCITRIEDTAGRKEARGEGIEASTEGNFVARGGRGMLLSTHDRPNAEGHITDMPETVECLDEGRALQDKLGEAARQAGAQEPGDQDDVAKVLKTQNSEIKGSGGDPANGKFPEFQAPHLALGSPAGIHAATHGSTHITSNGHNAFTSGGHTSFSAAKSFFVSVEAAVRLFACKAGMRLIAAGGDIDIKALKHSVNVLALLQITQTADKICINGKTAVEIAGGGSGTRWSASGIEHRTNGVWRQQAANHSISGPANVPVPALPQPIEFADLVQKQNLAVVLRAHAGGRALVNEPYALYKDGVKVDEGVTDERGQLVIKDHQNGSSRYSVKLGNGHEIELPVHDRLDAENDRLAARGVRRA